MRLAVAAVAALLACSCQQGEGARPAVAPLAEWEATESRLDSTARDVALRLQQLAREPDSAAALEALDALEAARQELHKTRVTMVGDVTAAKDPAASEQALKTAEQRMTAVTQKLEKRIAAGQSLLRTAVPAPAPASDGKTGEPPPAEPETTSQ